MFISSFIILNVSTLDAFTPEIIMSFVFILCIMIMVFAMGTPTEGTEKEKKQIVSEEKQLELLDINSGAA